jgi:hypothetical protein
MTYSFKTRSTELAAIDDAVALLRSAIRNGTLDKIEGIDVKNLDSQLFEIVWAIGHGKID